MAIKQGNSTKNKDDQHLGSTIVDRTENSLMSWDIKTINAPPKEIMKVQFLLIAGATAMNLLVTLVAWENLPAYTPGLLAAYVFSYVLTIIFILISRQKTAFNYTITKHSGEVELTLHFSSFSAPFFKFIAIFTASLFIGAAIYTHSLLFLVGPAAIALGSAKFLLGWKNKTTQLTSSPWQEYNFVTIDTKRLMVVAHRTNPTVGFEARFPNKELLDQYLSTIKLLLPAHAKYEEKSWSW